MNILGMQDKKNIWLPDPLDMERVKHELKRIIHEPQQDVCIVFERDNYIEVVTCNEEVRASFGRFIIAADYFWNYEEKRQFDRLLREENMAYDREQLNCLYNKYVETNPEWHLKFNKGKPLRLLDHIYQCMHPGNIKEILYKAGLDEFAANIDMIEEYNLIGTSPSDIFSRLSMRLLRAINCPMGALLINTESKRRKMFYLQNRYSWMFDQKWNESLCKYVNQLLTDEEELEIIVKKIRRQYDSLQNSWSTSQYSIQKEWIRIRECIEGKIGKKMSSKIRDSELLEINKVLVSERDYWNEKIVESNKLRKLSYEYSDDMYSITYPHSIEEYVLEAIEQRNCLLEYLEDYVNNYTDIMFLRKKDDLFRPFVTVEIFDEIMTQAYQKCNEEPDEDTMRWLKQYAKAQGIDAESEYLNM